MALVLPALAAPAARADLPIDPQGLQVTEQPAADGIIAPGDTVALTQTIHNSQAGGLTGLSGTLTGITPGAVVGTADSDFPDAAFGDVTSNSTPFTATLPADLQCGQNVDFSLGLKATQGTATLPVTVGTGVAGPLVNTPSPDVPRAIPDVTTVTSAVQVDQPGRIKDLHVDLGQLTHGYDGDLKIWIEAPDGSTVVLVDRQGGNGDNFTNTVFGLTGSDIAGASAPFSGTFRAQGDLSSLIGHQMQGTWTLHVADQQNGDSGTLISWGLDLAAAACDGNPIASLKATPNPVVPNAQVTLDASASRDPNGTIEDYQWDLDGDGTYETDTGTTPTVTTSYPTRGLRTVRVRVIDNQGNPGTASVSLAVTRPPSAALTWLPLAPQSGDVVTLDGSGSTDPDGTIVRYQWDLNGDGTYERDTSGTPTTTVSFAHPGVHTVRLLVTDDAGATSVRSVDISVVNRPPVAALDVPAVPVAGQVVSLDASGSTDPDGSIVRYEWDLDGDGTFEQDTGPVPTTSTTWPAGPATVRVRVTDDSGATDVMTVARVVDAAPVPALSVAPSPAVAGTTVTLSAAGSVDPDGSIARYEWDTDGDGTFETDTGTVPSVHHVYASSGTYNVKLRVTDDRGVTSVISVPLTVTATTGGGGTPPPGGGGNPGQPGGPGPGGPSGKPPALFSAGLLGAPIQALRLARTHGVTLRCHVVAAATCTLLAYLPAAETRRLHLAGAAKHVKDKLVGRAVVTARPGADGRVVLALSAPLRRALARVRTSRLLVRGTAVDALGRRVSMVRVVLLRG